MSILYNCHTDGDNWRITKFNDGEVESSYLCSTTECQCPAGSRPICRHRLMLPMFLNRGAVDTFWFLDWERKGWVDNSSKRSELDSHTSTKPYDAFDYTDRSELGSSNLEPATFHYLTNEPPIPINHVELFVEYRNEQDELTKHQFKPTDKPSWRRI